jgi:hypothetical protein
LSESEIHFLSKGLQYKLMLKNAAHWLGNLVEDTEAAVSEDQERFRYLTILNT